MSGSVSYTELKLILFMMALAAAGVFFAFALVMQMISWREDRRRQRHGLCNLIPWQHTTVTGDVHNSKAAYAAWLAESKRRKKT